MCCWDPRATVRVFKHNLLSASYDTICKLSSFLGVTARRTGYFLGIIWESFVALGRAAHSRRVLLHRSRVEVVALGVLDDALHASDGSQDGDEGTYDSAHLINAGPRQMWI